MEDIYKLLKRNGNSMEKVCKNENLSEGFISGHNKIVSWVIICIYQDLSEEFITEHKDKVDWLAISAVQDLSEEYILKNIDILTEEIFDNKNYVNLSDKTKKILEFKLRR